MIKFTKILKRELINIQQHEWFFSALDQRQTGKDLLFCGTYSWLSCYIRIRNVNAVFKPKPQKFIRVYINWKLL